MADLMFSLRVSWESWDGVSATPFRNHGNSNNYVELNPIVLAEQKEKYRAANMGWGFFLEF